MDQGLFIFEASRTHTDIPQWVGLLWTSDQPEAEISDDTKQPQGTDFHAPAGFETAIPASKLPQT